MVPNIRKGASFRGAMLYYLHDKRREGELLRLSDERVAWTATRNCAHDAPEFAISEMIATADSQEQLKQASGEHLSGRPCEQPVMTISLSWHPSEKPDRAEIERAADSYLKHMGLDEHQAVYSAHNDTDHAHVHIIVNRIHPETGKVHDDAFSKNRSQMWARDYERERGHIWCQERVGKDYTRPDGRAPHGLPNREAIEAREEAKHYAALEAAAMALDKREKELLSRSHQEEREAFFETRHGQFREARQVAYREVREAHKDRWVEHFREAEEMRHAAGQEQRGLGARVVQHARAGEFAAAWRALADRDPIRSGVEKAIAEQRRDLRQAQRAETRARQDAVCKELYEERRLTYEAIKQRQKEERAELKEVQADRAQQRPYDKERLIALLDQRPPQPDRALHEQHMQERLVFLKQGTQAMRELRGAIRDEVTAEFASEWKTYGEDRAKRKQQAHAYDREARRARRHYRRHGPLHGVEALHQIKERQRDYHKRMRKDLREQRRALSARMRELHAALIQPALAHLAKDRDEAYIQLLAHQHQERADLARDRVNGRAPQDDLRAQAPDNLNGVLTLEQIKAYKAHAMGAVSRNQQFAQTRDDVTAHKHTGEADHGREGGRRTRETEKTAQQKFEEYFAQHGDRLRREGQEPRQQTKSRGR